MLLILNRGTKVIAVGRNQKKIFDKYGKYLKSRKDKFDYKLINMEHTQNITPGLKSMMMKLKGELDILISMSIQSRENFTNRCLRFRPHFES